MLYHPAPHAAPAAPRRVIAQPCRTGLAGAITVPGDKSISHRAIMIAGLAVGETRIIGLLEGEDVLRTAAAMRALGVECVREADAGAMVWTVRGRGIGGLREPQDVLDMGNSGTAARLLAGVLAGHDMFAIMTGDASLRSRPMARIITPLAQCGARFAAREGGRLPLAITGARVPLPLEYRLPVASAQVKSAVLLAGLSARGQTRVEEPEPTRDHTETMLAWFGANITSATDAAGGREILLAGQPELRAADVAVPGDPSSAAFPLVAALLVPGSGVQLRNIGLNPLRAGLFATLQEMGADLVISDQVIAAGEPVGTLTARHGALHGIDVPAARAPSMIDEYPILAVAASCAAGTTRLCGLRELRVKESDRLAAMAAALAANGVRVQVMADDLIIHGAGAPPPGGGLVQTHMDHRIAMAGVVLGLAARKPVQIDDIGFVDTSFPGFAALMRGLGAVLDDAA